jgi:hypothetical protein
MSFYSPYSPFIGIAVIAVVVFVVVYCVRANRAHRNIAPHPMQVVVLARPGQNPYPYEHPQMCWTVPIEQAPPPYNAAMTAMNTNCDTVHVNNGP